METRMKTRTLALALTTLMIAGTGLALAAGSSAVDIRKMEMKDMGRSFKSVVAMAKGNTPYDAAAIEGALSSLAKNARDFPDNFPAGSDKGDTDASSDIWSHFEDFKAQSLALADNADAAAKAGDFDTFKSHVMKIAKGCQSCHDSYRN